ncbi:hypothetical protein J5N97_002779 [Dioscorea zingiberensis]|uniref:Uncharacterized protein n=1 Tax=Dioscorea zingiberensis TaxID=325984 RepID=A0A9D5HPT0_9LILI|nr:hypothetical protein J5N97_002779 [Dioscorea zingiberensis]
MHTNGISISTTHSKKQLSSHHGRDSGELAVFEASRYFSGDVDELSFSFASERFPWRHAQALPPQEPNERKLIDKKLKTIASYIISFLLQMTPKKRLPNNRHRGRKRSSFYSCGSCGLGESGVWEEEKKTSGNNTDFTWRIGRTKSFDNRFHHGKHGNGHKALGELESGLFFENKKWVLNGSNGHGVEFIRRDDGEISDSSSDLFELRNIDELPVYG